MFGKKVFDNNIIERIPDPQTGETIHRAAIAPELVESVRKTIQGHSGTMQQFVSQAQTYFIILKGQMELLDKIKKADDAVKEALNDVVKKAKLDNKLPWQWNMQLQTMEYRSPPVVEGMTDAEIKKSLNPGVPPTIASSKGIVV